jgi:uncharacterized protein (TIGR02246 family)
MTTGEELSSEAQIRQIISGWADAVRAKDAAGLIAHVAPDVLLFDVVKPLRSTGSDALAKRAEQWLSAFEGPVEYEVRDLNISAGDDVAFCHSLNRVNGTTRTGTRIDMWWRATVCFRQVDEKWMVTHEHSSVPFDMDNGKAAVDLQP